MHVAAACGASQSALLLQFPYSLGEVNCIASQIAFRSVSAFLTSHPGNAHPTGVLSGVACCSISRSLLSRLTNKSRIFPTAAGFMPSQPADSGQVMMPCDVKALQECLQRTQGDMQKVFLACHWLRWNLLACSMYCMIHCALALQH